MVIIGIDPGTATMGFGVLRVEKGRIRPLDVGVFLTQSKDPLPQRLASLYTDLNTLMDRYQPDTVATERLFFGKNVTNALSVGRAIGVVLLAVAQRNIPWAEYMPAQIKLAVTGEGNADKQQVQYMVTRLLGLQEVPKPDDAADALAIAVCHAHSYKLRALGMER